jgi:hypothetical protein
VSDVPASTLTARAQNALEISRGLTFPRSVRAIPVSRHQDDPEPRAIVVQQILERSLEQLLGLLIVAAETYQPGGDLEAFEARLLQTARTPE